MQKERTEDHTRTHDVKNGYENEQRTQLTGHIHRQIEHVEKVYYGNEGDYS